MPITVEYASDSDAPRAFEIEHEAYTIAADPIEPLIFPGPFPPDANQKRAVAVLERKALDPTTVWLKAVDTETGEMIVRLSTRCWRQRCGGSRRRQRLNALDTLQPVR